jgi:hypothetical protein
MARLLLDPEQVKNHDIFCVSALPTASSIAYIQTIQEYSPRKLHRLMYFVSSWYSAPSPIYHLSSIGSY